jgi:hypothetical protein
MTATEKALLDLYYIVKSNPPSTNDLFYPHYIRAREIAMKVEQHASRKILP